MKYLGWRIIKTVTYVTFKLEGVSDVTDFDSLDKAKEFIREEYRKKDMELRLGKKEESK